jgi:transcriptional regulator with XRE-family HTH domain
MDARQLVAWNLKRWRLCREISQERLAVDAEIDRTYVSRLERGLENPTVGVLERLAAALSIEIGDFFQKPQRGERLPKPLKLGRKKLR